MNTFKAVGCWMIAVALVAACGKENKTAQTDVSAAPAVALPANPGTVAADANQKVFGIWDGIPEFELRGENAKIKLTMEFKPGAIVLHMRCTFPDGTIGRGNMASAANYTSSTIDTLENVQTKVYHPNKDWYCSGEIKRGKVEYSLEGENLRVKGNNESVLLSRVNQVP